MNLEELESEHLYDVVEEKIAQAIRAQGIEDGTLQRENFTKRDLGLRETVEIYQAPDNAIGSEDIQRGIDRAAKAADKISKRESRAVKFITDCCSVGFYGYLKLRRWFGIPLETFAVKTWYGGYLPKIPLLVNPGGVILLREGTYTLSTSVNINTNNVMFTGVGAASILTIDDNVDEAILTVGDGTNTKVNIQIKDIQLNGNKSNQTINRDWDATGHGSVFTSGILLKDNVDRTLVKNVYVFSTAGPGILVGNATGASPGNERIILRDIYAESCAWEGIHLALNQVRCEIINCHCILSDLHGMYIYSSQYNSVIGGFYENNGVVLGDGIMLDDAANWNMLEGVTCRLNNSRGIYIIKTTTLSEGNTITGCNILENKKDGLVMDAVRTNLVSGCFFRNNGSDANNTYSDIVFQNAANYNVVSDCLIQNAGTNRTKYGIEEKSGCDYNTIYGGFIWGTLNNYSKSGSNTVFQDIGYIDGGILSRATGNFTAPSVPASGTAQTNTYGYPCLVSVYGGTVSDIQLDGVSTGQTSGTFVVPPSGTIKITYTSAPTWKWYGL